MSIRSVADLRVALPFRMGRELQVARSPEQSKHAGPKDLRMIEARLESAAQLILSLATSCQRTECLEEPLQMTVWFHDACLSRSECSPVERPAQPGGLAMQLSLPRLGANRQVIQLRPRLPPGRVVLV